MSELIVVVLYHRKACLCEFVSYFERTCPYAVPVILIPPCDTTVLSTLLRSGPEQNPIGTVTNNTFSKHKPFTEGKDNREALSGIKEQRQVKSQRRPGMKDQITNLCIQTYYNLYGVMPDAQELAEMIGEDVATLDEKLAA